jgi:pilus assembly protein CpaE
MSSLLHVAIVDSVDETREVLQREVSACSDLAWLEADCQRYEVFPDVVQAHEPHVALVSVDGDPGAAVPLIHDLSVKFPRLAVVAIGSNTDARFASDLIRAGAKDYVLFPPRPGEIADVFTRLAATASPHQRKAVKTGSVRKAVIFAGTDGGIGTTTLAVNVGCILAQDPNLNVCLLDLDLSLGDAHVLLDLSPRCTLTQLVENIDALDASYLKRAVAKHASGLHVVPHPDRMSDLGHIQPQHVAKVIALLKRNFTHVLIDLSKGYTLLDQAALDAADDVLMVMQPDMNSLYNLMRLQESLDEHAGLTDKVRLVANRVGADFALSVEKAEATIGKKVEFQIFNDTRTATFARDNGKPLYEHARGTRMFQAIVHLAEGLTSKAKSQVGSTPSAMTSGILGRLFGAKR